MRKRRPSALTVKGDDETKDADKLRMK